MILNRARAVEIVSEVQRPLHPEWQTARTVGSMQNGTFAPRVLPAAIAGPFVVKLEVRTAEHAGHVGLQYKVDCARQAKRLRRRCRQAGGSVMRDAQVIWCDRHLIWMGVAPGAKVADGEK